VVKESYIDIAVLKRFVEPEEIARAALFLASDASSAMTGQIVKVDCGRF
jgi:enoyl-[acyl-carrier-protein] reductase (NADH)